MRTIQTTRLVRTITAGLILLISDPVFSQLTLILPEINEYYVTPASISDVTIIGSNGGELISMQAILSSAATSEELLTVQTSPVELKQGMNRFRHMDIALSSQFGNSELAQYIQIHHNLPIGQYRLCVIISPISGIESSIQECVDIQSNAEQMLNLVYPFDGDTIDLRRPPLNWIHTGPFIWGDSRYVLTLSKLNPDQTVTQALNENLPIVELADLRSHQVSYPMGLADLEEGQWYAWKVECLSGDKPVSISEQWKFFVRENTPDPIIKYIKLNKDVKNDIYKVVDGRVYFMLKDISDESKFAVTIQDMKGRKYKPNTEDSGITRANFSMEDNGTQFILDLKPYRLDGGHYILTINTPRNIKYSFTIEL